MIDGACSTYVVLCSPEIGNEIMFIFAHRLRFSAIRRIPRTKTDPGVVIEVSGRVTGLVVAGRVWGCLHARGRDVVLSQRVY